MSISRFEIQQAPQVAPFILFSLGLHICLGLLVTLTIALGLFPSEEKTPKKFPPIKVSYLPPEKKTPSQKAPTFVDAPRPEKAEAPRHSELIARYDSRAHSNLKPRKRLYQNKKTAVPKTVRAAPVADKSKSIPKKKITPATRIKKPFRPADRGFALPQARGQLAENPPRKKITGGTLALLEGFDPEKYAALDTQTENVEDDAEVISLDTRETKYASYFARIKRQIERVWGYPEEAARRGISGRLTLRFQISRDGNLMNVRLIDQSGHVILDEVALQAVKAAAPYYPFPVTIDRESLSILATFIYSPAQSSQYFPRR